MRILFSDSLLIGKKGLMKIIVGIAFNLIPQNKKADNFMDILMGFLRGGVRLHSNFFPINITEECKGLIDYAFLGDLNKTKGLSLNLSSFFVYKLLIDSTKNKNDLLTYDNCLYKPTLISKININNIEENGVVPAFIITSFDRTIKDNKNLYKVNTELESKYFIASFCFPQGINKGNSSKYAINGTYLHCTNEDYSTIVEQILAIFLNIDNVDLHTISIKKNMELTEANSLGKISIKIIPFIILLVPYAFYIILLLNNKKKLEPDNKEEENETLISNDNQKNKHDNNEKNQEKPKKDNSKNYSELLLFINNFFNFKNNLKELFNNDTTNTKYNHISGLNYVLGLIGISILLTILGQIYLILYNLPMKDFGQSHFYKLIRGIHYIFYFIGLRYSPRIIFSCSGFILSYKYY